MAGIGRQERSDRLARARRGLRDGGFAACLSVAPETHCYLSGYDAWVGVNSPQALVFGPDESRLPSLLLRDVDRPLAEESFLFDDIRCYGLTRDDPAALMANLVESHAQGAGPVAIEMGSFGLTHAFGRRLEAALAPRPMLDATDLLGRLRLIKSPAEMKLLRRAAGYAETGLDAFRSAAARAVAEGASEIALAGAVEQALRGAGSDYWAIPIELASGRRSAGGHATPTDRPLAAGDLVHIEFAGVAARYHAVAIHSLALGEPGARVREIYALTEASLRAGAAAIRPGVPVAEVEEASLAPLRSAGLEDRAMMRFGYGVGIAYPPIWLESLQIARGFEDRLEPGMVFVLHGCLELPEERLGVILGGTYALTDDGLEMLAGSGAVPLEIL